MTANKRLQPAADAIECALRALYFIRPQLNRKRYPDPICVSGGRWADVI